MMCGVGMLLLRHGEIKGINLRLDGKGMVNSVTSEDEQSRIEFGT